LKKILAILMIAGFVFTLIPGGCGGDKAKAQEYLRNGDEILLDLKSQYLDIASKTDSLINDYSQGKNTEPAGVKARIEEIEARIGNANSDSGNAAAAYNRILDLRDVPDYRQYAEIRLEMLSRLQRQDSLFEEMLSTIDRCLDGGQAPDMARLQDLASQVTDTGTEISGLDQQAIDLKAGRKL
jgi:hypothetical protein